MEDNALQPLQETRNCVLEVVKGEEENLNISLELFAEINERMNLSNKQYAQKYFDNKISPQKLSEIRKKEKELLEFVKEDINKSPAMYNKLRNIASDLNKAELNYLTS